MREYRARQRRDEALVTVTIPNATIFHAKALECGLISATDDDLSRAVQTLVYDFMEEQLQ
jgi:hypothetical protein